MVYSSDNVVTCACGAVLEYDDEEVCLGPISYVGEKALYIICPDCGRMVPISAVR